LAALAEACKRTGWRVHACVLMSNHYHLMLETPEPNLVAGMHWFQTRWTARFNRRRYLFGHVLQGRYKAVLVDPETPVMGLRPNFLGPHREILYSKSLLRSRPIPKFIRRLAQI
jgi:hypothetical protein